MNQKETNIFRKNPETKRSVLGTAAVIGATALVALGFAPRADKAPEPTPAPETYDQLAQKSAQEPYDPAKDELVIDGIRIKPGNPEADTASEATLGNAEVQEYMAQNPAEASSITASTMKLPTNESGEYVVVKRDIDSDGDTDAVVASVGK